MAYAVVDDIEARLGRTLTDPEITQVIEWIEDLSSDIRLRIPDVATRIMVADYGRLVKRVIAETIISKLRNPEGLRQRTVSIDDYSETKTVDVTNSSGRLSISESDWDLLVPGAAGQAFTIRTYYGIPS